MGFADAQPILGVGMKTSALGRGMNRLPDALMVTGQASLVHDASITPQIDTARRLTLSCCARMVRVWRELQDGDSVLSKAEALDLIHKHLDDMRRAAHSR